MAILIPLAIIVVALWGIVRYLETNAIFFPGKYTGQTPALMHIAFEDLSIPTPDGATLNAWFVKAKDPKAATLIFAHGNAGAINDRLLKLKFFHDMGLNVLLFDYRGYGKSTGKPTEQGIYTDGAAVYDYALTRKDIDPKRIIYYGVSLGGIVAIDVASKRSVAALIVDSTITSAKDSARKFYPYVPTILMRVKFDSIGKIKNITAPKLIMHSRADRTIPYEMGVKLYEAAREPKTFLESSGAHNEIQIASDPKTAAGFKTFLVNLKLL